MEIISGLYNEDKHTKGVPGCCVGYMGVVAKIGNLVKGPRA